MKKSTLLIIGADDPPPQKIKRRLSEHSYHIVCAPVVSDIFELVQTHRPDLFIFYSTQYTNRDALRTIKNFREIGKRIPVILITKYSSEKSRRSSGFTVSWRSSSDGTITGLKNREGLRGPIYSSSQKLDQTTSSIGWVLPRHGTRRDNWSSIIISVSIKGA